MAPEFDLECLTRGYGEGWKVEENSFKPYACCRHTHSANFCVEQILAENKINPEEILSITDDTYSTAVQTTNNPYPENPYAAKFSVQFCIAAALILGDLSDKTFTMEYVNDPRIRRLMPKITARVDERLDREFRADPNQWSHRLTIRWPTGASSPTRWTTPSVTLKTPLTGRWPTGSSVSSPRKPWGQNAQLPWWKNSTPWKRWRM